MPRKADHSHKAKSKKDMAQSPCHFIRLPYELRVEIYRMLLQSDARCLRHPKELTNRWTRANKPWTRILSRRRHEIECFDTAILGVNRQLHGETLPLFYSLNTFQFKMHDLNLEWRHKYPEHVPAAFFNTPGRLKFIKHMSLKYPELLHDNGNPDVLDNIFARYINKIRLACPILDQLTLNILYVNPNTRYLSDLGQLQASGPISSSGDMGLNSKSFETIAAIKQILPHLKTFEILFFGATNSWKRLRLRIAKPEDWIPKRYPGCTPRDAALCSGMTDDDDDDQDMCSGQRSRCTKHWYWGWPNVRIDLDKQLDLRMRNKEFVRMLQPREESKNGTKAFVDKNGREWEEVRGFILRGGKW